MAAAGNLDLSIRINADGTAAITGLRRVDDALGDLNQGAQRTSREVSGLGDALKGMVAAAAGFVALDSMISGFTDANVEAGRLRASLETVTGSVRGASDAWDSLSEFAKQTPFDLAQSVDGFIALKARGLDPSIAALESYGNTASAMSKSMNDMIQLVADAAMGQFSRLAEFGINAEKSGDQVAFTFNKVTTVVKNNAQDIEKYLQSIGKTEFASAMARQMDTLGPAMTNVKDAVMAAWVKLGDSGLVSAVVDGLKWIAEWIERISKSMAAGDFDAWIDGLQGIAGAATGATGVYLALSAAVEAATIAQTAFNLVVSANPYVLAALAVGALVGGLYTLRDAEVEIGRTTYALRDGFQAVWEEASALAVAAANAVAEGWFHTLSSVTAWFNEMGVDIGAVATGIADTFKMLWEGLQSDAKGVVNRLVNLFIGLGKTVGTIAAALVTAFSRAFDDIAAIAGAAMFDLGHFDLDFTATKAAIADAFRAQVENARLAGEQIGANFDLTVDHIDNVTSAAIAGVERIGERTKDISLTRQLDAASAEADKLKETTVRATGASRSNTAALSEQAGATDMLTKAQRESNAELATYVERAGNVLGLSQQQKQVMIDTLPAIQSASKAVGVPQDVIMSIIDVESAWKKAAYNSKASATGMMQIIPSTARMIAKETGLAFEDIMTKPAANIEAGTYLIGKLIAKYGDLETALRAYNAGEGDRLKSSYGWKETNNYVKDVTANVAKLGLIGEGAADVFAAIRQNGEATAKATEQARAKIDDIIENSYSDLKKEEIRYRSDLQTLAAAQLQDAKRNAQARLAIEQTHQANLSELQRQQAELAAFDDLTARVTTWRDTAVNAAADFRDSLVDALVTGQFEFGDFVDRLRRGLAELAVDQSLKLLVGAFTGGDFSAKKADAQTGFMGQLGASLIQGFLGAYAHGGVVRSALAQGIYTQPTVFAMATPGHHAFATGTGLLGEAGPEAVLPLTRIRGELGVKAVSAAPSIQITVNNRVDGAAVQARDDGQGGLTIEVVRATLANDLVRGGTAFARAVERRAGRVGA